MSDFEIIDEAEFKKAQERKQRRAPTRKPSASKVNTDDRTKTGWYKLPGHRMGFCTVPSHDELQKTLKPEAQAYRQEYPIRMVFTIGEFDVCRDCYVAGLDKRDTLESEDKE